MLKREMFIRALKIARAYRVGRVHADVDVRNRVAHQVSLFPDDVLVELEPWQVDDTTPQYRIDVGNRSYYALDDAEREGILARIEAEGIQGQVEILKFSNDLEEGPPLAIDENAPVSVDEITERDNIPVLQVESFELTIPPKGAEFVLYLLLSKEDRESIPGDLQEEFSEIILPRFGRRKAWLWYWAQVVRSILPLVASRALRLLKFVVFAKITATVARWLGS